MAKENFVFLHGQLYDAPKIFVDANGEPKKASMAIRVLRRPNSRAASDINFGKLNIDIPIIMTLDREMIRECSKLKKGDMVDIRGVYTTREIKKKAICPQGHDVIWAGNFVFITPIYICRREQELSPADGFQLLKERNEISNMAMMIGTLCREPELIELTNTNNRPVNVCQYQLASNRRYHIRDGIHEQERTDYPWVKTAGAQALEDYKRLHMGSVVYINGAIQTREIEREISCPVCETPFLIKENVCELFPYSIEYLMNCDFEDEDCDTEEFTPPAEY